MASKFLVAVLRPVRAWLSFRPVPHKTKFFPQNMTVRTSGDYIHPTQYDIPISTKLKPFEIMFTAYELIPLFFTTACSIGLVVAATIWAMKNKVDVVFSARSRENISRTMDLRNPTSHKFIIIDQVYEPWPEMYDLLDKMKAEHYRRQEQKKDTDCDN